MLSAAVARPTTRLRVIDADEVHTALSYLNVVIVLWNSAPRAEQLHQLYALAEQLTREFKVPKVAVISVVERKMREAPSPPARAALSMLHRDPKGILQRFALVFLGEGFVVANVRSVLLSVRNRLMGKSNTEVFKRFGDAIRWATEDLEGPNKKPINAPLLIAEVEQYLELPEEDRRAV